MARNRKGQGPKVPSGSRPTDPALVKEVSALLASKSFLEPVDTAPTPRRKEKISSAPTTSERRPHRGLVSPTSCWYEAVGPLEIARVPNAQELADWTSRAAELYAAEKRLLQDASSAETGFFTKMISSGTLSDRLSALTLLVQGSPLHNTKSLETLKGMVERGRGKGGREESLKALRCIVDWWVGGGAPDRKLKYFRDQALTHPGVTDVHLVVWFFEDWLKKYFYSLLQIIEALSLDSLDYVRVQVLGHIFKLLRDKPEQEQNLLRLLVNKLGDGDRTICSRASHHVLQLLQQHPSMKSVVIREIISLVFRPAGSSSSGGGKHIRFTAANQNQVRAKADKKFGNAHATYYAVITLNQIVLSPNDRELGLQLIDVYFEMFKELVGGVNGEPILDTLEREDRSPMVKDRQGRVRDRKTKLAVRKEGLDQDTGFVEVEDDDSKLISAILTGINRALPFVKGETGMTSLDKHIDTLFLITHKSTFNISLQALVLVQQICNSLGGSPAQDAVVDRYYRTLYSSLHDPRLGGSSKQAMYLNLLLKSIKGDVGRAKNERVKALVRRFIQVLVSGGGGATEFTAGGLIVIGELFNSIPGLGAMIEDGPSSDDYDPRKRDPQYASASSSPLWELTPLLHHYHPTVSLHARQLLSSQPLSGSGDLSVNTLSHFLDRFVYKNPKKAKTGADAGRIKGGSAMQPAASGLDSSTGVKLVKGEVAVERVNEAAFAQKRVEDVPVDQVFFHKFFTRKHGKGRTVEVEAGSEKESDEGEIWEAMRATMAIADEDGDEDEDDLDGLEELDGSDSDSDSESDLELELDGSGSGSGSDSDSEWNGIGEKRKRVDGADSGRKKAKAFGTFASYESYARMIEEDSED